MSDVVEMYRDAAEAGGRDRYSCSVSSWKLLQEIGQAFGWQPAGATYVAPVQLKVQASARRDYQPGGTLDQKCIEQGDATAWAGALELAKGSPHLAAMLAARGVGSAAAVALWCGVLEEFVQFAYGGAFTFLLSSGPQS